MSTATIHDLSLADKRFDGVVPEPGDPHRCTFRMCGQVQRQPAPLFKTLDESVIDE